MQPSQPTQPKPTALIIDAEVLRLMRADEQIKPITFSQIKQIAARLVQ